ncbi:MAG: sigma 54-interacting transcriptional regulator [Proteobacteria bacterium]|nr:PAS domain S-box protein [Desulfobacula sp.]MBU3952832.1 sigma 54-interacting transcriptional regulator [Pseudomonadota bacterium]MBU4131062.1 sigma 54-interacting transcriptional regulator [Pseudomonadota bacterium]
MTTDPKERSVQELLKELEMYQLIFNSINHGATVIDPQGRITHLNEPYGRFLGIDPEKQIGKHCTEVFENTRMHVVARTGKAEINQSQHINRTEMVVQRIPIKKEGRVIAVYGQVVFRDISEVRELAGKLSLLESKVKAYEKELFDLRSTRYTCDSIIGKSREIRYLKQQAGQAAANDSTVMVTGESGTGKELFAQAIHHGSRRSLYPFIRINCAAIPKDLLESELFGYEEGAFTGAKAKGKPGKFELADKGTIFLDELGDLPLEMQPKLLRVLEEKEFERIGGTRVIRSDFRVICATNQDLEALIREKKFRKDLFYRLNVIPIEIPPLRERREDILPIARHLLEKMTREADLLEIKIERSAEQELLNHDWPGNVRELSNVLERAMYASEDRMIYKGDLPFSMAFSDKKVLEPTRASLKNARTQAQVKAIYQALAKTGYNKVKAAGLLGIHRTLLYKKMKEYNIGLKPK